MSELLKIHDNCMPETCPLYDVCKDTKDIDSVEMCVGLIMGTKDNLLDLLGKPDLGLEYGESYQKVIDELDATLDEIHRNLDEWGDA
jgi:hypothetical protein